MRNFVVEVELLPYPRACLSALLPPFPRRLPRRGRNLRRFDRGVCRARVQRPRPGAVRAARSHPPGDKRGSQGGAPPWCRLHHHRGKVGVEGFIGCFSGLHHYCWTTANRVVKTVSRSARSHSNALGLWQRWGLGATTTKVTPYTFSRKDPPVSNGGLNATLSLLTNRGAHAVTTSGNKSGWVTALSP